MPGFISFRCFRWLAMWYPSGMSSQTDVEDARKIARGVFAALVTVLSWARRSSPFASQLEAFRQRRSPGFVFSRRAWSLRWWLSLRGCDARRLAIALPFVPWAIGHALYNLALAWGQAEVPAATASFIISSAPVWMVVFAVVLGQERFRGAAVAGMLLSFAGVALIAIGRAAGSFLMRRRSSHPRSRDAGYLLRRTEIFIREVLRLTGCYVHGFLCFLVAHAFRAECTPPPRRPTVRGRRSRAFPRRWCLRPLVTQLGPSP